MPLAPSFRRESMNPPNSLRSNCCPNKRFLSEFIHSVGPAAARSRFAATAKHPDAPNRGHLHQKGGVVTEINDTMHVLIERLYSSLVSCLDTILYTPLSLSYCKTPPRHHKVEELPSCVVVSARFTPPQLAAASSRQPLH